MPGCPLRAYRRPRWLMLVGARGAVANGVKWLPEEDCALLGVAKMYTAGGRTAWKQVEEELHRRASAEDPRISLATVYRTVRLFEEAGIIERHDFRDGRSRYEEVGDDHHDHLIDLKSGEVVEFVNDEIERLQEAIARKLAISLSITGLNYTACRWKKTK